MTDQTGLLRPYNSSVRIGNWYEENVLQEEKIRTFLQKKESGELLIQKTRRFAETFLSPQRLSDSPDGNVRIGDHILIIYRSGHCPNNKYLDPEPAKDACVSAFLRESDMNFAEAIEGPCDVTGYTSLEPSYKTVFVIESCPNGPKKEGDLLRYGERFLLRTLDGVGGHLYLRSEPLSIHKFSKKARHQELLLVSQPDTMCEWIAKHSNPQLRVEFEMENVPANEAVVLTHAKTNQNLCLECDYMYRTPFGYEYEVTCFNKLDPCRVEQSENHWYLTMNRPGSDLNVTDQSAELKEVQPRPADELATGEMAAPAETLSPSRQSVEATLAQGDSASAVPGASFHQRHNQFPPQKDVNTITERRLADLQQHWREK